MSPVLANISKSLKKICKTENQNSKLHFSSCRFVDSTKQFAQIMHSGVYTDLYKDYISSEMEPRHQKIFHGAVTFTFSIFANWVLMELYIWTGCADLFLTIWAVNINCPKVRILKLKISVFCSLMLLLLHTQYNMSPRRLTHYLSFPVNHLSWQTVLWAV